MNKMLESNEWKKKKKKKHPNCFNLCEKKENHIAVTKPMRVFAQNLKHCGTDWNQMAEKKRIRIKMHKNRLMNFMTCSFSAIKTHAHWIPNHLFSFSLSPSRIRFVCRLTAKISVCATRAGYGQSGALLSSLRRHGLRQNPQKTITSELVVFCVQIICTALHVNDANRTDKQG